MMTMIMTAFLICSMLVLKDCDNDTLNNDIDTDDDNDGYLDTREIDAPIQTIPTPMAMVLVIMLILMMTVTGLVMTTMRFL